MTFYVTDQNIVVLILMLSGVLFAFFRDILKVKRHFLKSGKVLTFIEDFLYCAVCGFVFQITVFVTNYGYVRWYEFAGVIFGFGLYRILLEELILKIIISVTGLIAGAVSYILGIVLSPVRFVFLRITKVFKKCYFVLYEKFMQRRLKIYSDKAEKRLLEFSGKGFYSVKRKEVK